MKRRIFMVILMLLCFALAAGCSKSSSTQNNNIIDTNGLVSMKMFDCSGTTKDVKRKADRNRIISLMNSVKITENTGKLYYGIGFGVILKYDDNREEYISFCANIVNIHSISNKIDKNIFPDLQAIYNSLEWR